MPHVVSNQTDAFIQRIVVITNGNMEYVQVFFRTLALRWEHIQILRVWQQLLLECVSGVANEGEKFKKNYSIDDKCSSIT
jgi:hypothetical protein